MGVRQIYYGENNNLIAFASERKALWKIGLREPTKCVLPGHTIIIAPNGSLQEFKIAHLPKMQHLKNVGCRGFSATVPPHGVVPVRIW